MARISAIFDDRKSAEQAVNALRDLGVADQDISVIAQHTDEAVTTNATDTNVGEDAAIGAGAGLVTGAGIGAMFGLAAILIPGVGPFITAGALATALSSTAAGAVVGGATGALAGALSHAGYDEYEAGYYGARIESGGTLVMVNNHSGHSDDDIRATLARYGGHYYGATGTGEAGYNGATSTEASTTMNDTTGDNPYATGSGGHNIVTGTPATTDDGKAGLAAGAVIGGAVGAAIGGPVGAVIGGTVGSLTGGVVGDAAEASEEDTVDAGGLTDATDVTDTDEVDGPPIYMASTMPTYSDMPAPLLSSGYASEDDSESDVLDRETPLSDTTTDDYEEPVHGHNIVTGDEATTDSGKTGLGVGAVVGGAIGAAVGGPVGAIVGGTVGSLFGGVAGDAAEAADRADVNTNDTDAGVTTTGADYTGTTTVGSGTIGSDYTGTVTPGTIGNDTPGIQTGGLTTQGPDTRGLTEKASDVITGDYTDDKTGGRVI